MMTRQQAVAALTAPGKAFEMGDALVGGRPVRVWKRAPATLRDILQGTRERGDTAYLVHEDERLSYDQHFRAAARLATAMVERLGVRRGDRVAIAMRNLPEWVISFWAATAAGAVVVPLNAWWTAGELRYALIDCAPRVVVADGERAALVRAVRDDVASLEAVVVARASRPLDGSELGIDELIAKVAADAELPEVELAPDDDATIFYTSGTTGRARGAVGTHRNACNNQLSLAFITAQGLLRAYGPEALTAPGPQRGMLVSVPFFHVTGCLMIMVSSTLFGGKLVLLRKWDPGRALELVERERVTILAGVPSMVMDVLDHPDVDRRDLSSVHSVSYGGAPAPPELVRRIAQRLPQGSPSNGYGLTETSGVTTMNAGADYVRKPHSVGPPVPVCDLRVVDDASRVLPAGEVGELQIRGPNVVRGYWNRPDETAAAFGDGWFRTGDLACIDEEGFVSIVDRTKDLVIRGGENVYCVEVEDVLHEHPAVADAAVIGVAHPVLGEEVGAVVRLRPGASATSEELRRHVAGRLAAYKVPVHVWLRDDPLPRSPTGKLLKRELREELARRG